MSMSNEELMASCGMDVTIKTTVGGADNKELLETSQTITESESIEEKSDLIEKTSEVSTVSEETDTDIAQTEVANDSNKTDVTGTTESTDTNELEEAEVEVKKETIINLGENENLFALLGMEMPKEKKKVIAAVKPTTTTTKTTAAKTTVKSDENALKKDTDKIIKVYGQEVKQMSKEENADLEEIRLYLVDTLGFREFQQKETEFKIINDGNTQIIIPRLKFKPKG